MINKKALPEMLETTNGITIRDVELLTDFCHGGGARYASMIVQTCCRFKEQAYLETPGRGMGRYDCKNILGLLAFLGLNYKSGHGFSINVEPNSPVARDLALTLYSTFTEEDNTKAGVNRFANPEIPAKL